MKERHFSIFDFEEKEQINIQTSGYEMALHELCKPPYSYKIVEIQHRNEWSIRVHVRKDNHEYLLIVIDPNLYTLQQLSFLQKRELRLSKIAHSEYTLLPIEYVYDEKVVFQKYPFETLQPLQEYITTIQLEILDWVPEVLRCIQQISCSLSALHQNLHFHLGLSWENLYVDSKGHFKMLGFGMGARFTNHPQAWLPPEIHIGYPQSEVGDFFAIGKLIEIVYQQIPIFEQEKYHYLEEVYHRLLDDNPLHRLQSHENLQILLEPSKVFRFYRHWNTDIFTSSKMELHTDVILIGNEILTCDSEYLYKNGLSLPTTQLFQGKLLSTCHPILWNFFYIFDDEFKKSVNIESYSRLLHSMKSEEQVFVSWLHRIKKEKKELINFATILDSYAHFSDIWSHLIDYFQRQWPEYRCMFVQFDHPKQRSTQLDYLCTLPIFQHLHQYQYILQNCIDQAETLEDFLDLSLYFLIFNGDSNKAQKIFAEGLLVELSDLPKDILEVILQSLTGSPTKSHLDFEHYDTKLVLKNSQSTIKMIHYAILLELQYLADMLLDLLYRELIKTSITNQLRFVQNITIGLGNHPIVAHVCLELEKKVYVKKDVELLCSLLHLIGLDKRIDAVKRSYQNRVHQNISHLKSIAVQNNIDIQSMPSQINTKNLSLIKMEIERKLQLSKKHHDE
jgi:hypothetical protein